MDILQAWKPLNPTQVKKVNKNQEFSGHSQQCLVTGKSATTNTGKPCEYNHSL